MTTLSFRPTFSFALSPWQKWRLEICMESAAEFNDITKICCTSQFLDFFFLTQSSVDIMTLAGLWTRPLLRQHLQDIQNKPITLQEACFKGLDVGVSTPKIRCSKSFPPCHPWGDLKTLEDSLSAAGANIDEKDAKGISCLGYAIGANRTHVVKKLLENKAGWAGVGWGSGGWVGLGLGLGGVWRVGVIWFDGGGEWKGKVAEATTTIYGLVQGPTASSLALGWKVMSLKPGMQTP